MFQYYEILVEPVKFPRRRGKPAARSRKRGKGTRAFNNKASGHRSSRSSTLSLAAARKESKYIPGVTGAGVRGVIGDAVATVTGAEVDSGAETIDVGPDRWEQVNRSHAQEKCLEIILYHMFLHHMSRLRTKGRDTLF